MSQTSRAPIALALSLGALIILGAYPSNHIYTADGLEQIDIARCLAASSDLDCPGLGYWPPVFSLFMLLAKPFCGTWEAAARLVSLVSVSLVPALVYHSTRLIAEHSKLVEARLLGGLAGVLAFASPNLFFYAEMADNRSLYLLLAAALLYLLTRLLLRGGLFLAGAAAGLASLAALTRPEGKALLVTAFLVCVYKAANKDESPARRLSYILLPLAASAALFVPYAYLVQSKLGLLTTDTRAWEMTIIHWAVLLPKDVILSLFGFTVHGTPLRAAVLEALQSGQLTSQGSPLRIEEVPSVYLQQLPVILALAWRSIPPWLWIASPFGVAILFKQKQWPTLSLLMLYLAPFLLYPALPQSIDNDKIPTGNFLVGLMPLAILSTVFVARLLERVPEQLRQWALPAIIPVAGISLGLWAGSTVQGIDEGLRLFEGHPLPRGAAAFLKANTGEDARLVTSYPGTVVAHFAGKDRTPMPSVWELDSAFEAWQDKETIVILVNPDLTDKPLMVSELVSMVPRRCAPLFHLRGEDSEWIFGCRVVQGQSADDLSQQPL